MPNAFRPDSEIEINRIFKALTTVSRDLLIYELFIHDKWGKLIFHTDDINKGWDGTFKGKECPPGVYLYLIKARETVWNTDLSTGGSIMLIK
jgi:gliding motility-associated-like protein